MVPYPAQWSEADINGLFDHIIYLHTPESHKITGFMLPQKYDRLIKMETFLKIIIILLKISK